MAQICKLRYECLDDSITEIHFYKDTVSETLSAYIERVVSDGGTVEAYDCLKLALLDAEEVWMCGTENPLVIAWGDGDRYATRYSSSAKLNLTVKTLTERQILEDIFNGGWVMDVYKDSNLYWKGEITQTLGIEQYKAYPYTLSLNANDGLGDTKNNQFLTIDFPTPWSSGAPVSYLDVVIKLINKFLWPRSVFKLFVANNLYVTTDDGRQLETTYIDPLVFMNDDDDQYIRTSDVIESLLGIFDLRLYQWQANWYLVSRDAQWNAGTVQLTEYDVAGSVYTYIDRATNKLGILDLYSCDFSTDYQIAGTTNINFIAPLRQATLKQDFQMNTNILPAFANRSATFYRGFDGVDLEYNPTPIQNRMKWWTNVNFFEGIPWTGPGNENAGYLQVPIQADGLIFTKYAYVERELDATVSFNRFFFAISSNLTQDGEIDTDEYRANTVVRNIRITFVPQGSSTTYYFWRNNSDVDDPDAFADWTDKPNNFRWQSNKPISLEGNMPENAAFTGGTFRFYFYNGNDNNINSPKYNILFHGLQLGIVSSSFKVLPDKQRINYLQKGVLPILGELLLSPMPIGIWTMYYGIKDIQERKRYRKTSKARAKIGSDNFLNYESTDIVWEDDVILDINPNGNSTLNFDYRFGITLQGVVSYHDVHISSAYNRDGDSLEAWLEQSHVWEDGGETTVLDLITYKGRGLIRDNTVYTTELVGGWRSPSISPLQLVNDFEGRVYYQTKAMLTDKRAIWTNTYTEFKALKNVANLPIICDFNPFNFNEDFCLGSQGIPVPGFQYSLTIGNDGTEYGFSDTPPYGAIAPTFFQDEWVFFLSSKGQDIVQASFGIPTQSLLPNISRIDLFFVSLDETVSLFPDVDHYVGTRTDIRDYLMSEDGNTIKITLNPIE